MNKYQGKSLAWHVADGVVELALDRAPANEIGLEMLEEPRTVYGRAARARVAGQRSDYLQQTAGRIFRGRGFARPIFPRAADGDVCGSKGCVREFLERIHAVLNQMDASPLTTIAAVHGVCFGGGF